MKNNIHYKGLLRTEDPNIFRSRHNSPASTNGKLYTIGKKHYHRGPLDICKSGLHSCTDLCFVNDFYSYIMRYCAISCCEVIPFGKIEKEECHSHGKICSSGLYVVRELTQEEIIDRLIDETMLCSDNYEEDVTIVAIISLYNLYFINKNKPDIRLEYTRTNISPIDSDYAYNKMVLEKLKINLTKVANNILEKRYDIQKEYIDNCATFFGLVDILFGNGIISSPKDIHKGIERRNISKIHFEYRYKDIVLNIRRNIEDI